MACTALPAFPQTQQAPLQSSDAIKADIARLYSDAHPYMDEPLPELKKTVRELAGLKPAPNPEQPSDLVAKVGVKADELLQKVPDLISDEAVRQTQYSASLGLTPGCVGTGCLSAGRNSGWDRNFSYLILTHPAPEGTMALREYRTTSKGKPVEEAGAGAPSFQGFISAW
ncbi:MAG: hypothetical protein WAO10_21275, partial [Candidatus Sulfotelmatobacter sp.]